jgi:hypothetical protein
MDKRSVALRQAFITNPFRSHSMKSVILSILLGFASIGHAATFLGNGNSGFGGVLGTGSLLVTDNGSAVTFTFTKGSASFNDYLGNLL